MTGQGMSQNVIELGCGRGFPIPGDGIIGVMEFLRGHEEEIRTGRKKKIVPTTISDRCGNSSWGRNRSEGMVAI